MRCAIVVCAAVWLVGSLPRVRASAEYGDGGRAAASIGDVQLEAPDRRSSAGAAGAGATLIGEVVPEAPGRRAYAGDPSDDELPIGEVEPLVKDRRTSSDDNTSTPVSPAKVYVVGPNVSNKDIISHCSSWKGNLSSAQELCDSDPRCFSLHSWGCEGDNWRYCSTSIQLLQMRSTSLADKTACSYYVDNRVAYVDGPLVSNTAAALCSTWYGPLEEAQAYCDNDPDCTLLHDFACDQNHWRYCQKDIQTMRRYNLGDTSACTMVADDTVGYTWGPYVSNYATNLCSTWTGTKQAAQTLCNEDPFCTLIHDYKCDGNHWRYCTNQTTTTLKATGPDYGSCTMVKTFNSVESVTNNAYSACSAWHGTLFEAQNSCRADPECTMLHDFNCDDAYWRYCVSGSLTNLKTMGSDSGGCSRVAAHAAAYHDGPKVSNIGYKLCSTWTGSFAEAHRRCEVDPTCKTLFDWSCDGLRWRTCSLNTSTLQKLGSTADACTKVPIL